MQKSVGIIVIGLLAITLPVSVFADHGTQRNGAPCATSDDAVAVGDLYIDGTGPSVYQESNGQAGLQRGSDDSQVIPDFPDIVDCSHPDTIIV